MEYKYKVKITGNRDVYLRELTVDDYKNIQKTCIETDLTIFEHYIDSVVSELSDVDISELNLIDIYVLVLEIRRYSISDDKMFTTHINGKAGGIKVTIDQLITPVIDTYNSVSNDGVYEVELDDFAVDSIVFDPFSKGDAIKAYRKSGELFEVDGISDFLPISIKKQIDDKISHIYKKFSDIQLFKLTNKDGADNVIGFELDKKYVYEFLRVMLKDDLKSFYQNIFDLKRELNIGFHEHKHMTLSEMEIYISMYNKHIEEQNEKNKGESNNGLPNI